MRYGEIIALGNHKLMCGDATNRDDVMRLVDSERVNLVLTDPPYGINTHGNYSFKPGIFGQYKSNPANRHIKIIGDKDTEAARRHYDIAKDTAPNIIMWGGNYFTEFLPPSKCWLIWNKKQTLYNHADCELAWTNIRRNVKFYEQLWSGACRAGSYKLNPRPCIHPTQKPVELHMRILEDFTSPGDIVLDCFGGSGTTLVACEMTGRRCLMMEISPEYCDVIKGRYEKQTDGKLPLEG